MELKSENNYLLPVVFAGSVWLAGKSLSELNKTVSDEKTGFIQISINTVITYICFEHLFVLTRAILPDVIKIKN